MTHQEILEKAIAKAIAGGWDSKLLGEFDYGIPAFREYYYIIFNHDFAKALWSKHQMKRQRATKFELVGYAYCESCGQRDDGNVMYYCHLYHLQQMVIADDPIKYLGENI